MARAMAMGGGSNTKDQHCTYPLVILVTKNKAEVRDRADFIHTILGYDYEYKYSPAPPPPLMGLLLRLEWKNGTYFIEAETIARKRELTQCLFSGLKRPMYRTL